jgi:hypothetical protein
MTEKKVFISHSSKDHKFVKEQIIDFLESHNISTWHYIKETLAADEFDKKIRKGLQNCEWFLVAISKNAIDSDWVKAEVDWATENRKGKIIPILLEKCQPRDLHLKMGTVSYINFTMDINKSKESLLSVLRQEEQKSTIHNIEKRSSGIDFSWNGACPACGGEKFKVITTQEAGVIEFRECTTCGTKFQFLPYGNLY